MRPSTSLLSPLDPLQHNVDPDLPQVPLALSLQTASPLYQAEWRRRGWEARVRAARVHHVAYEPAVRCVVVHELVVEGTGGVREDTFGVIEVRPDGLDVRDFRDDPDLPWLGEAAHPELVERHLRELSSLRGASVRGATPVRYRPGSRCVLRFDVETPLGERILFGKMLRRDGAGLSAALAALLAAGDATRRVRVVRPMAYLPELHMFLFDAIRNASQLHAVAFDREVAQDLRLRLLGDAGSELGRLHATPGAPPERRGLDLDAALLASFAPRVARVSPPEARLFEDVTGRLASQPADEGPSVPSHGSFRSDQLLLHAGRPTMLDLDQLCSANPARDIANFLAYLRWKAIRQPEHAAFIERGAGAFLAGYAAIRDLPAAGWIARYEAVSLLKIAGRRFRNLDVDEWPLVPRLLERARSLLSEEGLPSPGVDGERAPRAGSPSAFPPRVRSALDPDEMSIRLRPLLPPLEDGASPTVAGAKVLAHRPGRRWTIAYELSGSPGRVMAKVYTDPVRGRRAHGILRAVWASRAARAGTLVAPQPIGWIRELSMSLYLPLPGQALAELLAADGAAEALDRTAGWLSELHGSRLPLDRVFDMRAEMANVERWSSVIGERYATGAGRAEGIATRLSALAEELDPGATGPIHKDFHPQHVYVGDRIGVIDFDEARLGHPSFDLAHFCAYLTLLGLRTRTPRRRIDRLGEAFLAGYERRTSWRMDERFPAFYAYSCLKIAWQLTTGGGMPPAPGGAERRGQLESVLDDGLAAVRGGS